VEMKETYYHDEEKRNNTALLIFIQASRHKHDQSIIRLFVNFRRSPSHARRRSENVAGTGADFRTGNNPLLN